MPVTWRPSCLLIRTSLELQLRFASTVDPMDGQTTLSLGSAHYMNFFGDAPWELCGRESHEDLRSNRNTRGFVVLGLFRVLA